MIKYEGLQSTGRSLRRAAAALAAGAWVRASAPGGHGVIERRQ